MIRRVLSIVFILAGLSAVGSRAAAQTDQRLTIRDAEAIALQNHPRVKAAQLNVSAASEVPREVRSAYLPNVIGSMTGADAPTGTRIAAGAINNPTILSRYANGFSANQLITDFGRTANLAKSADLQADAANASAQATRASVLLQVNQTYYAALRAQALLNVAKETVSARQLVLDQVTALMNSKLKSALDLSFAQVNLAQARLDEIQAQNNLDAAFARLSAALGYSDSRKFELVDEPLPPPPPNDLPTLVNNALKERPEVISSHFQSAAAEKLVQAEKDLNRPTITARADIGYTPFHTAGLTNFYADAGINVSLPILNGHLFRYRAAEAQFRAQASQQNSTDVENQVKEDVRVAWLNANTAYQRLGVTAQLVKQAREAFEFARVRYLVGLSSIIELSQAQLNLTSAEITDTSAQYDYQIARKTLDYQTGLLR